MTTCGDFPKLGVRFLRVPTGACSILGQYWGTPILKNHPLRAFGIGRNDLQKELSGSATPGGVGGALHVLVIIHERILCTAFGKTLLCKPKLLMELIGVYLLHNLSSNKRTHHISMHALLTSGLQGIKEWILIAVSI